MANKHSTAVISDLAKLLESAEFSDLVLRCEGQDFKVHRCIISSRSPFFAAACSGEFQEAQKNVVEVTMADGSTLMRMLTYIYTGDYDDSPPQPIAQASEFTKAETETEIVRGLNVEEFMQQMSSTTCNSNDMNLDKNEEPPKKADSNDILKANTLAYVAADYYQIPLMKDLALTKFRHASNTFSISGFADVVALVYESTSSKARKLRSSLCSIVVKHAVSLVEDSAFMAVGTKIPEFIEKVLPELVKAYEVKESRLCQKCGKHKTGTTF